MPLYFLRELAQRGLEHGVSAAQGAPVGIAAGLVTQAIGVGDLLDQGGQAVAAGAVLGGFERQDRVGVAVVGER